MRVVYDGGANIPPLDGTETVCVEPGARQSEAEECDINRIVAQFVKTGVGPAAVAEGVFADVSEITDFRSALERMRGAEEAFMTLPPKVRFMFDNDALKFVEFAVDPANRDKMVELGLADAKPVKVPEVPAVEAKP